MRFTARDYNREGGEYDIRYFAGDTRHGQGVVCRGLRQIKETYLQCMLEVAATSRAVYVDPDEASGTENQAISEGFEAMFDGGEETYDVNAAPTSFA